MVRDSCRRPQMAALALAAAISLAGSFALAQPAPAPAPTLYLFIYRAGPAWQAGKPMVQQSLGPHVAYIRRLLDDGRLVAGGPMLNVDEGLAIVRAGSATEAEALLAADPAIASGIFTAELRAWQPLFDSGKPLKP